MLMIVRAVLSYLDIISYKFISKLSLGVDNGSLFTSCLATCDSCDNHKSNLVSMITALNRNSKRYN